MVHDDNRILITAFTQHNFSQTLLLLLSFKLHINLQTVRLSAQNLDTTKLISIDIIINC